MGWLLHYSGENLTPVIAVLAFPIVVYATLLNFWPIWPNK